MTNITSHPLPPSCSWRHFFLPGAANCSSTNLRAVRGRITLHEAGQRGKAKDFGATKDWIDVTLLFGHVKISLSTSGRHKCEEKHSCTRFFVSGQLHAPTALILDKVSPEHVIQRQGVPRRRSGHFRWGNNLFNVSGFELRTLSVADRGLVTILTELTQLVLSPSVKHDFKIR